MQVLKRSVKSAPVQPPMRDEWPNRAEFETAAVLEQELAARIQGEVRFDRVSRALYATDASNYSVNPVGVVLPRTQDDVIGAIDIAISHGIPVLPRGGGSSLAGQAVGAALVIDTSKYLNRVLSFSPESRQITVEPGIVLTNLNKHIRSAGLMFGPDPSSANRATVGGVIANNASGSHSILYGMAADHIIAARAQLSSNTTVELEAMTEEEFAKNARLKDGLGSLYSGLRTFRQTHAELIEQQFPKHWRRASGYNLPAFLEEPFNPAKLLASSEGTLATLLNTTLNLVPAPERTGLVLLQFDDLVASMEAVPLILEAAPSAVELMDRMLIDLCRQTPGYGSQISFIEGDPAAVLVVEFFGDHDREVLSACNRLTTLLGQHGVRLMTEPITLLDPADQRKVWNVRKAGLGILMSVRGDAKPIPVIEDVSVPVEHLPAYVARVEEMVARHNTTVAIYAHASAGCLHVRPLLNLKTVEGINAMVDMANEAADLVAAFGGSMSGEHGDGLQRSQLNERIFGSELYGAMRELKNIFDPLNLMNPGKKVDAPPMTEHLRYGTDYKPIDIKTHMDFSREGGFLGAIEACNGSAVCRQTFTGTMCPSYQATRDENDTTRGRANALRAALTKNLLTPEDFANDATFGVLELCLSCKACKTECPTSVDMAKIKTEFLAQYYDHHRMPMRTRMMGHMHRLSQLAAPVAPLANMALSSPVSKPVISYLGIHPDRKLPHFHQRTFVHQWLRRRTRQTPRSVNRGKIVYFHDTWVTFNYPHIGLAAVALLEAAGFDVIVEARRACCGRTMLSKGMVDAAARHARRNVTVLAPYARRGIPIVGTEPSCILTLRDEYLDLVPGNEDARVLADHVFMIDEFLAKLDAKGELGIQWKKNTGPEVFFHGHCHQKSLIGIEPSMALLKAAGCRPTDSGAGCCGMAGSFGYETEHYDVSRKIGEERLFPALEATHLDVTVAVAGVSCAQQIQHFTNRPTKNIVEVLAERVDPTRSWRPRVTEFATSETTGIEPTDEDEVFAEHQRSGNA